MVKTCVGGTEGRSLPDVCCGGPVLCGVQGQGKFRCRIQMYDEIIKHLSMRLFNFTPSFEKLIGIENTLTSMCIYRKQTYMRFKLYESITTEYWAHY